jgi:hypothetical protein
MIARRFTLICLTLAIFGMGLASLVAEAGHTRKNRAIGAAVPCVFTEGPKCGPQYGN